MRSYEVIARALAAAFVAGPIEFDGLVDRGANLLGRRWRWLRPLARRVCDDLAGRPRPRQSAVAELLLGDDGFAQAFERYDLSLIERLVSPEMSPAAAAISWAAPTIRTTGELADWLAISVGELDWFADRRSLEYKQCTGPLRNYHYRALSKRFGHVRLIEAPKPRLKEIQRRILTGIVDRIPVHATAHGFRRRRSIKTFASPHVGKRVVMRMDLQDFFPSISLARIQALFRTVGYPERVADLLAGLCTNSTPLDVWDAITLPSAGGQARTLSYFYAQPHLPQGAPTSPALANLCAYRLDCRLAGLAASAAATYTRYADDLAFSGDDAFRRVVKRFQLHVGATVMQEGFAVHHRKTRIMRHAVRQRLAGVVVNERLNVTRADYDQLKAILTNCVRHGAETQNRAGHQDFQSHLLGRISFVAMLHPARGHRLRELFEQIDW